MSLPRCILTGDSIAASMRARKGWRTIQYAAQRRMPGYHLIEHARPGWTASWPEPWRPDPAAIMALQPAVVVVWLGVNDYFLGAVPSGYAVAYRRLLDALAPARLVLVLPGWYADESAPNGHGTTLENLRDVLRTIATGRGLPLLDPRDAVPPGDVRSYDDRPALHYNDRGNRKVGIWLGRILTQVLA